MKVVRRVERTGMSLRRRQREVGHPSLHVSLEQYSCWAAIIFCNMVVTSYHGLVFTVCVFSVHLVLLFCAFVGVVISINAEPFSVYKQLFEGGA